VRGLNGRCEQAGEKTMTLNKGQLRLSSFRNRMKNKKEKN
jgi:hypothetical protein